MPKCLAVNKGLLIQSSLELVLIKITATDMIHRHAIHLFNTMPDGGLQ